MMTVRYLQVQQPYASVYQLQGSNGGNGGPDGSLA